MDNEAPTPAEREHATSAIRYLEAKAAPTSGIVQLLGTDYATAAKKLIQRALADGWIQCANHEAKTPCGESSQSSAHPFAAAMAARRARKTDNNPNQ